MKTPRRNDARVSLSITAADDLRHMRHALSLARRSLGQTWPNPSVGCVLVKDGAVVGRGATQKGGRPHAETMALSQAGPAAQGATAYVTLEPCSHHGQTPPCAEALIAAGIARAVVALVDPDPRVAGRGLEKLKNAGIKVELGLLADDAAWINSGFLRRVKDSPHRLPWVTLKLATSLDGRIALEDGRSRWITGPEARRHAHMLRCQHDAIMTGIGTVLADDPLLTVRLPGYEGRQPMRIVMDTWLRTPLTARLVQSARQAVTLIYALPDCDDLRRKAFENAGVAVGLLPPGADHRLDPRTALERLVDLGITRVMIESGGKLAAAVLGAGLVDEIYHYQAGVIIGGDGLPAIAPLGLADLRGAPRYDFVGAQTIGPDRLAILKKAD